MTMTDPDKKSVTDESGPSTSSSAGVQAPRAGLFDRLRSAFGLGGSSIRDDIEDALDEPGTTDAFSPQERAILRNVLSLHEQRVEDVMVPRADIIAIGVDATLADVLALFRTAGHSRLPVHGETLDDPRGMIHIRDFVDFIARSSDAATYRRRPVAEAEPQTDGETDGASSRRARRLALLGAVDLETPLATAGIIRPVLFIPPSMPALDLLVKMQATRTHMALVIDEYGGTDGLVSIEDVVEMIVGDIEDEHDLEEAPQIEALGDNVFVADARASIEAVSEVLELDLGEAASAAEVDTLGGLITAIAGHLPTRGQIVRMPDTDLEFEVLDADPRRVKRVRIHRQSAEAAPSQPG